MVLLSRNHFAETQKSESKSDSIGRKTFPWAHFHVTLGKEFCIFSPFFSGLFTVGKNTFTTLPKEKKQYNKEHQK